MVALMAYVGAMSGFGLPYVGSKSKPRRRDMPQKGPPRPSLANTLAN